jgi:hypothetical protein
MSSTSPPLRRAIHRNRPAGPPIPAAPIVKMPPASPVVTEKPKQSKPPAQPEKPKGPAQTQRKPRPPLVKADNPRRVRRGKASRKLSCIAIDNQAWGCPFRPREVDGRWYVVWDGDAQGLLRSDDWQDIPCDSRLAAAQTSQDVFRIWITAPAQSDVLEHTRRILRGYHLVCRCLPDYPCHGDILIRLLNNQS